MSTTSSQSIVIIQLTLARDIWQDKMDLIDQDAQESLSDRSRKWAYCWEIIVQLGVKPIIGPEEELVSRWIFKAYLKKQSLLKSYVLGIYGQDSILGWPLSSAGCRGAAGLDWGW